MSKRHAIALSLAILALPSVSRSQPVLDVVGMKLGMSPAEVSTALNAHQPRMKLQSKSLGYRGRVTELPASIVSIAGEHSQGSLDMVHVEFHPLTQRAFLITRSYVPRVQRPNKSEVLTAILEKFGRPSYSQNLQTGSPDALWAFDEKQQWLEVKAKDESSCSVLTLEIGNWWMKSPPMNLEAQFAATGACGRFLVRAKVSVRDGLVDDYGVSLADVGTLARIGAEVRAKLEEMDKAELERRAKGTGAPKPKL